MLSKQLQEKDAVQRITEEKILDILVKANRLIYEGVNEGFVNYDKNNPEHDYIKQYDCLDFPSDILLQKEFKGRSKAFPNNLTRDRRIDFAMGFIAVILDRHNPHSKHILDKVENLNTHVENQIEQELQKEVGQTATNNDLNKTNEFAHYVNNFDVMSNIYDKYNTKENEEREKVNMALKEYTTFYNTCQKMLKELRKCEVTLKGQYNAFEKEILQENFFPMNK